MLPDHYQQYISMYTCGNHYKPLNSVWLDFMSQSSKVENSTKEPDTRQWDDWLTENKPLGKDMNGIVKIQCI